MKKAVTLIELIVAMALLGVIFLTGATIDIASRKFFNVSDRAAELQNAITPALLRIKRDINLATGSVNDPGLTMAGSSINIRLDVNNTPNTTADDVWVTYTLNGNNIEYTDVSGTMQVIANKILPASLNINVINTGFGGTPPLSVQIDVTACYDPDGSPYACGTPDNPQLRLETSAHAISHSGR